MVTLSRTDNINEATKRLDAALDALETLIGPHVDEIRQGETVGALRERLRLMTEERDQLLIELDQLRARTHRLESANDEVSGRLEALRTSLADNLPTANGSA